MRTAAEPQCAQLPGNSLSVAVSLHKQPVGRRIDMANSQPAGHFLGFLGPFCVFLHVCASCYAVLADRPSWHDLLSTVCPTCIHTGFHSGAFACHAVICALFLGKIWMNPLHHFIVMVMHVTESLLHRIIAVMPSCHNNNNNNAFQLMMS